MAQWNYFEAGHRKGPCDGLGEHAIDFQMWPVGVEEPIFKMLTVFTDGLKDQS